jgi:hypothetical protein
LGSLLEILPDPSLNSQFFELMARKKIPPHCPQSPRPGGCSGPIEWDLRESNPSPGLNWDFKEVLSFLYERAKRPIEDIGTPPKAVSPEKDWKIFTQACSAKGAS